MNRKDTWRKELVAFVDAARARPYKPGENDCATFCAGALKAMTGEDFFPAIPSYSTIEEGLAHLQALGFEDHVAYAASKLEEKPINSAVAGDLVVLPGEPKPSLGVCQGEFVYTLGFDGRGRSALGIVPMSAALRVFQV